METDALFDDVERRIAELRDTLDACSRAILLARAALWLGLATLALVFTVAGALRTAPVVLGAITAVIGGIVWSGASRSSRGRDPAGPRRRRGAQVAIDRRKSAARNGWRDLTPGTH